MPAAARRRRPFPVLLVLLAGLLVAGILAAVLLAGDDEQTSFPSTAPVETITLPGTTIVETVTTAPEEEPATTQTTAPTTEAEPEPDLSPSALNDEGFQLMQQGNYEQALPLLEQSVAGLEGSGELTEAYASYNLAFTRFALGRCDGVLELLARSEQVQGQRKEIDRLRRDAERQCLEEDD